MSFKGRFNTIKSVFVPRFFYFYEKQITNYSCPICKFSSNQIKILEVDDSEIILCKNCNNAWTNPAPKSIMYELEDFYDQFSFQNIDDLPVQWKMSLFQQIKTIKTILRPEAKILEIGCGQGIFLKELRRNGFNVYGIEPSYNGSKMSTEEDIYILKDYFPSDKLKEKEFNLIYLSQVFEHISDFNAFLDEIVKILCINGKVFFFQTNFEGFMPRFQKSKWYGWAISQHFWHFTPSGLSYILKQKGFEIENIEYTTLDHHNRLISRIANRIKYQGDAFQLVARLK